MTVEQALRGVHFVSCLDDRIEPIVADVVAERHAELGANLVERRGHDPRMDRVQRHARDLVGRDPALEDGHRDADRADAMSEHVQLPAAAVLEYTLHRRRYVEVADLVDGPAVVGNRLGVEMIAETIVEQPDVVPLFRR